MASFDRELERNVLAACLRDPAFVRKATPVLRRFDFSSKLHAWIWTTIAEVYGRSRELPTARSWGIRSERDFPDPEESDLYFDGVHELRRRTPAGPREALEEIRDFIRMAAMRRAAGDVLEGIDDGDLDAAEAAMAEAHEAVRVGAGLAEPVDFFADLDIFVEELDAEVAAFRFLTPLPALNRHLGGGLRPGTQGILVAQTNVGKSAAAVDLGFSGLFRSGAVVCHVTTEETEREARIRYLARFTGIARDKLASGKLDPDDRALILRKSRRKRAALAGRLLIQEVPPTSSVAVVRAFVEQVREDNPDDPILVVVDTPDHLQPAARAESHRLGASAVAWTLKGLTLDPTLAPLALWDTSQAPGEFARKGKDRITARAVSETYDKSRTADVMVGLVESEEGGGGDDDVKAIEWHLVKNRLGRVKRWQYDTEADLSICSFKQLTDRDPSKGEEDADPDD